MPYIKSIASRIFGLAILLVCLMIVLVGFLLWQVTALDSELQRVAGFYTPLDQALVKLNETGLRRRIAFERWYGALNSPVERSAAIAEASSNYEKFTADIQVRIDEVQAELAVTPADLRGNGNLVQIRAGIDEVESSFHVITTHQRNILGLTGKDAQSHATDMMAVLDDLQNILQRQRTDIQTAMQSIVAREAHDAARRHGEILGTTIVATIISVLLGLTVATIVTRRLVQPVHSLMLGIRTAEKGDFSVQLPVRGVDEISALTVAFNFFIGQMRLKEELRTTFGKYIDPRILDRMLLDAGPAGGRQDMAVSFADLVGFTGIGEHLTPAGVVNLLNRHFTLQAEAIQHQHGVVDKFMGDAVMAFWGAPFTPDSDHALLACRGALHQVRAIARLQEQLPEITGLRKNLPRLEIRIGISSGEVVVGNIGSENTRSYTVIGDTVNLAARLERANRFYGTNILLCGQTRSEAGEAVVVREIDTIVVKGKTETTGIFELIGLAGEVPDETIALCTRSAVALSAYRARDWDVAERAFLDCISMSPGDRHAHLFLDRIAAFRLEPPADDWRGAWIFDTK